MNDHIEASNQSTKLRWNLVDCKLKKRNGTRGLALAHEAWNDKVPWDAVNTIQSNSWNSRTLGS